MAVGIVEQRPSRLRTYLELVRFSHTLFALPFAIIAALIAVRFGGDPAVAAVAGGWCAYWSKAFAGILLCMASGRTAAMAFNRLVDRAIDAANPRTAVRHLPRGAVSTAEVVGLIVASCGIFIASTLLFLPNWLPLVLSVPVLAWLLGYSYAKRFTMLAHVWLGAALGLAPIGAWIAIRGGIVAADPADLLPAVILAVSVTTWVAGFDTIYACQDADFDARHGLWSLPARIGVPRALRLAAVLHAVTLAVLAALPLTVPDLGGIYWLALVAIAALLVWEHAIVRPDDLSRVNDAFFTANAAIGLVLLVAIGLDLWL
jgi:4-hydroxybenzoate polyprenyltransferase